MIRGLSSRVGVGVPSCEVGARKKRSRYRRNLLTKVDAYAN
jgi:hypothetical protein